MEEGGVIPLALIAGLYANPSEARECTNRSSAAPLTTVAPPPGLSSPDFLSTSAQIFPRPAYERPPLTPRPSARFDIARCLEEPSTPRPHLSTTERRFPRERLSFPRSTTRRRIDVELSCAFMPLRDDSSAGIVRASHGAPFGPFNPLAAVRFN
ncbi:hypothetical protein KM043_008175 [Ampulex compressa]|nr:hypothetical protein KM043_008175 [Ampulex compressa]